MGNVGSQKTYRRKRHDVICQGQVRVISRGVMKAMCEVDNREGLLTDQIMR